MYYSYLTRTLSNTLELYQTFLKQHRKRGSIYSNLLKTVIYGPLQVIAIYIYVLFKNYSNTLKQSQTLSNIFGTTWKGGMVYLKPSQTILNSSELFSNCIELLSS